MAIVAPSILSADFSRLGEEIASISDAPWIHVDVMDGRFVPNITIGPMVVKAIRPLTDRFIDCHLMIVEPDKYLVDFREAGADLISVHAEAVDHLDRTVAAIKETGAQAGVALNPHTSESVLDYVLEELDLVLIMSVNPGFGGQSFIPNVESKIRRLAGAIEAQVASGGRPVQIQVDGGVKAHNIAMLRDWGVTNCVVGSGLFNDRASVADNLAEIHQALN